MIDDRLRLAALGLKRAQIAKSAAFDRSLANVGLTMALWVVLERIRANPAQSTHALAKASMMTDQSVGELVGKLAKRGLVERIERTRPLDPPSPHRCGTRAARTRHAFAERSLGERLRRAERGRDRAADPPARQDRAVENGAVNARVDPHRRGRIQSKRRSGSRTPQLAASSPDPPDIRCAFRTGAPRPHVPYRRASRARAFRSQ